MKKKKIFLWLPMVLFVLVLAGGIWSGTVPVRGLREVLSVSTHQGEILANGKKQRQLPIYSVETKDAVVALTFDCAWGTEDLDEVLRVLGEHGAKAAFFMTGGFISEHPEAVQKLAAAGHDLGTHGDHPKQMSQLSEAACREEITGVHTKIKNLTGTDIHLFRPPYGDYNNTVLEAAKACGYTSVQWSVDSLDWKDYGAEDIVDRVCHHKNLENGAIILLHTGTKYTAEALPKLLEGLEQAGYGFVSLSEMLLEEPYTIDHEGRQRAL